MKTITPKSKKKVARRKPVAGRKLTKSAAKDHVFRKYAETMAALAKA